MKKTFISFLFAACASFAQDVASLNVVIKTVDSSVFTTPNKPIAFPTTVLVYAQERISDQPIAIELTDDKGQMFSKLITIRGNASPSQKYKLAATISLSSETIRVVSAKAVKMNPVGVPETLVVK